MHKTSFKVSDKISVSLSSMLRRRVKKMAPTSASLAMGFKSSDAQTVQKSDMVSVIVQASASAHKALGKLSGTTAEESIESLGGEFLSAHVSLETVEKLARETGVKRIQTKKQSKLHLGESSVDSVLRPTPTGNRLVAETGKGVLIGVVDSGFDLSHPMFRDAEGKLRVEGLLDQTTNLEHTLAQLETGWANGANPGIDTNGHGTHVASIAAGSAFKGLEGIAPAARFLLVKTDFRNTDKAVKWIFQQAGTKPCVINMSLGHHFGPHDGTDAEELVHAQLTGPGKILVISAGNERERNIHVGQRFLTGEMQEASFDILPQGIEPPFAALTLWYDPQDEFNIALVTPTGQALPIPALGNTDQYGSALLELELSRLAYPVSNLTKVQIQLSFTTHLVPDQLMNGWGLRIRCNQAVLGRIDGWFNNSGVARFHDHALVESARTVGLAATGAGCLAVASHVSKNIWTADTGTEQDFNVVAGRSSPFSSMGPTRDGRNKPEVSGPGQYLTAALADGSEMAGWDQRAFSADRLLTIEGTSMAAPVVTGAVALLLQKKKSLAPDELRTLLKSSARHDGHTGAEGWTPVYGHGKLDIVGALKEV